MKILVFYPGHSTATVDVAVGWENALRGLGHDVRVFQYHNALAFYEQSLRMWGRKNKTFSFNDDAALYMASTRAVVEIVQDPPDVVLMITGTAVHKTFYECMKRLGVKLAIILTESPYSDKLQHDMCKAVGFDAVFINERASLPDFEDVGAAYLPHSYDPLKHYPREVSPDYQSDVFFLGTMYPERKRILKACNWNGMRAKLVGPNLTRHGGMVQMASNHRIANEEAALWYCGAKVNLNLNRTVRGACLNGLEHIAPEEGWSLSPRHYEIAACGGFQIAQAGRGELEEVFDDTVPAFSTSEELEELVRFYLELPGERMEAAKAQRAVILPCSFRRRAESIVLPVLERLAGGR